MKIITIITLCLISITAQAEQKTYLERTDNLQKIGQIAVQNHKPVVLFFNASYCLPCEKLKQRALFSLLRFNQFPDGVQFIEVFIDDNKTLTDFYGEATSSEDFALFYNVTELPTQVFVDGHGDVVAPPIVNNGAYDFYGLLVNDRIETALKTMQTP